MRHEFNSEIKSCLVSYEFNN